MSLSHWQIGIDEVGRGPLAGRLFSCAVAIPLRLEKKLRLRMKKRRSLKGERGLPSFLADSKKLSSKQREIWHIWARVNRIPCALSAVSAPVIDRLGVSAACNLASQRAFRRLLQKNRIRSGGVVADAGIRIIVSDKFSFRSFPRADETVPAVALASILAKVKRDKEMKNLHRKNPGYNFARHKGYGTLEHRRAIGLYGPSAIHRRSFLGKVSKNFFSID